MNDINRYISGEYTKKNHSYHTEDSSFKWNNFIKILNSTNFEFGKINSITDIGCGIGKILDEAKKSNLFNDKCKFIGYDINPDAIELAKKNFKEIIFSNEDFINLDKNESDLIIAADVFEHIEDSHNFLRKLKNKGNFFLFNIPLEISLLSMIRSKNIFQHSHEKVGHLHFYTKKTAILLLESCGYKIVECIFANNRLQEFRNKKELRKFVIGFPQYLLGLLSKDLASNIFGGFSLVVLAKK